MFNVTIHDLDPKQVRRIIYGLNRAEVDTLKKEITEEGGYDVSFYCKEACYMMTPGTYLLTVNNQTVTLNRYAFSFISIS